MEGWVFHTWLPDPEMVVYQLDDEICFGSVLPLQVSVTTMIITCLGKKGYQPKTNSLATIASWEFWLASQKYAAVPYTP